MFQLEAVNKELNMERSGDLIVFVYFLLMCSVCASGCVGSPLVFRPLLAMAAGGGRPVARETAPCEEQNTGCAEWGQINMLDKIKEK